MKKYKVGILALMALGLSATTASATPDLFAWTFNIDGSITEDDWYNTAGMPVGGSLDSNDLGTLTWTTSAAGTHNFFAFFDYEIDESSNTFFNESGDATNTPAATQSWEIDEPGYAFGDIYANVLAGTLDNSNAIPAGAEDDVSWAMGWNFNLAAGETALITLTLTDIMPTGSFYLTQFDPDSQESIYFASSLDIRGGGQEPIPEPATMLLFGTGLAGLLGYGRKKKA